MSILRAGLLLILCGAFPNVVAADESCATGNGKICIETLQRDPSVIVSAINYETYEATITVNFKLMNMTSSAPLPYTRTLAAAFRQPILTLLERPRGAWQYGYDFHWVPGSLSARHDGSVVYDLPYRGTHTLVQGFHGAFSHTGNNEFAVDFDMPIGTPVYAAREGVVVGAKSNFNQGAPDHKFDNLVNFIYIRHADGTIGEYLHLRQGGVAVKVGDPVRRNQVIGYSGNTGFTSGPHLHFMIFRASDGSTMQTFPMRFQTTGGIISPVEGTSYTSPL